MPTLFPVIRLPEILEASLGKTADATYHPRSSPRSTFTGPLREAALVPHTSVSWRVFKNPIALLVGGIAAVVLELAEPRIRTAIWQHSTFLADPLARLQRTGLAAMTTIYAARSVSEPMIARVNRMHARINGTTPDGRTFSAGDPDLLTWVHATATYCFATAYGLFADALDGRELDSMAQEAVPVSQLYGASSVPRTFSSLAALMESSRPKLESSTAVHEFLRIMRETALLPSGLRWLQPVAVSAALQVVPASIRRDLGFPSTVRLTRKDSFLIRSAGAAANRLVLPSSAACQACLRLGLPLTYLYRPRTR